MILLIISTIAVLLGVGCLYTYKDAQHYRKRNKENRDKYEACKLLLEHNQDCYKDEAAYRIKVMSELLYVKNRNHELISNMEAMDTFFQDGIFYDMRNDNIVLAEELYRVADRDD